MVSIFWFYYILYNGEKVICFNLDRFFFCLGNNRKSMVYYFVLNFIVLDYSILYFVLNVFYICIILCYDFYYFMML